jgi:NTE family protein
LAALHTDLGWDARSADLVVGTSAGSLTGAMLRAGTSPFDLASFVLGRTWTPDQDFLEGLDAIRSNLPPLELRLLLRPWQLPAPRTWIPSRRKPWAFRPMAIISSMLPNGKTTMEDLIARHLVGWVEETWPEGLWICAVRQNDGHRCVFGQQQSKSIRLSSAVAASCCIPGYFAPVTIAGQRYLDGGIHSPTNADLLVSEHLDLAIIVSPMSGGGSRVDRALRVFAQRRLRTEVKQLEQVGTKVIHFEPGPSSSRAMGFNPMATDGLDRVLQAAFFEAGAFAARPENRGLLAPIGGAR